MGKTADDVSYKGASQTYSKTKKRLSSSRSRRKDRRRRKSRSRSRSPYRSAKRRRRSSSDKDTRHRRHRKSKKHKVDRKKTVKNKDSSRRNQPKKEDKRSRSSHVRTDKQDPMKNSSGPKINIEKQNPYDNSDNESELNLDHPMERIVDYIDDKKELCHQTFKTLKGKKLRSMIPEILRCYNLVELRDMCHKELDGMSKKRVLRILNGDEPEVISSSSSSTSEHYLKSSPLDYDSALDSSAESASDHSKSNESAYSSSSSSRSASPKYQSRKEQRKVRLKGKKANEIRRRSKEKEKEKMSTPEAVVDSTCKIEESVIEEGITPQTKEDGDGTPGESNAENESKSNQKEVEDVPQDVLEVTATDLNQDLDKELTPQIAYDQSGVKSSTEAGDTRERCVVIDQSRVEEIIQKERAKKKELEILELEMRARAIKSMICAQEAKDPRLRLKRL